MKKFVGAFGAELLHCASGTFMRGVSFCGRLVASYMLLGPGAGC
jgi:hypothetical protein